MANSSNIYLNYINAVASHPASRIIQNDAGEFRYRYEGEEKKEDGIVHVIPLFSGIYLQFYLFHCERLMIPHLGNIDSSLQMIYCLDGRIEVPMPRGQYLSLSPGLLHIENCRTKECCIFPTGFYSGIRLFCHESSMKENSSFGLTKWGINLEVIWKKYCIYETGCNFNTGSLMRSLFWSMTQAPEECRIEYLRIKVLELLLLVQSIPLSKQESGQFVTETQIRVAQKAMNKMKQNLKQHYSLSELATWCGVSIPSLRKYFYSVYGTDISSWLRNERMLAAKNLLCQSDLPVYEIASFVGYENASKFSKAFRNDTGLSPREYRIQNSQKG